MKLEIVSIEFKGELEFEHVIFKAKQDLDLGKYVIGQTSIGIPVLLSSYWFPDYRLKKGEMVYLYTYKLEHDDPKYYDYPTFFWGSSEPLWVPKKQIVLFELNDWNLGEAQC